MDETQEPAVSPDPEPASIPAPEASAPPAAPPAAPPTAAAGPPPERPDRRALVFGLIAVIVVLALVGGYFVTKDDGKKRAARPKPGPGEVFLESASSRGRDAFTRSVASGRRVTGTTTTALASTSTTGAVRGTVVQSAAGSTPALYGGSQNNASCDPERLIQFLQVNPSKARAFAGVLGIASVDIPAYVRGLTPVLLTRDTRVTNHGYYNGRATPRQAILQAGTAVLVDGDGIPRVKCGCGNPLAPPIPTSVPPVYTGPQWPGFQPATTVVVNVDVHVEIFVLVDPTTGVKFTRPAGTTGADDGDVQIDELCALFPDDPRCEAAHPGQPSLGRGDVQATLRWSSMADVDLSVTDPTGAAISYRAKTSPSGGQLDVDANNSCSGQTAAPVENVFWPLGAAPAGQYTVSVTYYSACPGGEGPQAYTLSVLVDGRLVNLTGDGGRGAVVNGTVNPGESQSYTFTFGGTSPGQ